MVFDLDLLSIGTAMNKSHRNYANVMVRDGNVIISNGDHTFAIKYFDESLRKKKLQFAINDFPDNVVNVLSSKSFVIFKIEEKGVKKTVKYPKTDDDYQTYKEHFDIYKETKNFIKINPNLILMLDDDVSFFHLRRIDNVFSTRQFHGYTGKVSLIEEDTDQENIDNYFGGDQSNEDIEIGSITDLWKMIYSLLSDVNICINPGKSIYGYGFLNNKKVEFLISDAEWFD